MDAVPDVPDLELPVEGWEQAYVSGMKAHANWMNAQYSRSLGMIGGFVCAVCVLCVRMSVCLCVPCVCCVCV